MNESKWKPGTVALAKYDHDDEPKVFLYAKDFKTDRYRWYATDGTISAAFSRAEWWRLLVVLDPEDREQVERLWVAMLQVNRPNAQAALRSLIEDPKPEEPTGLGAVVEDDKGRKWIRVDWPNPWCLARPNRRDSSASPITHGSHVLWDNLDAVKVLSEGVTP